MNLIKLTQKLISIPSFIDKQTNEKEIGEFIYKYLKNISYLQVEKQEIENGRFNIIAKDSDDPKLLIACHMDTVESKIGWKYNQGEIKEDKLYGLGSCDMKGGTACILDTLKDFNKTNGLALLFYCDEEYDFKGMKKFIEEYSFQPELILSPEATNLEIINGCKGVIEIYFRVKGKTGYTARPKEGNNAINGAIKIVNSLKEEIQKEKYQNSVLGKPILNLAYLSGGLMKGFDNSKKIILGDRGNNIPDVAEVVIDIRTPNDNLNANTIINFIKESAIKEGLELEKIEIRSDLRPLYTSKEKLEKFKNIAKQSLIEINYGDITEQGYFDGELISKKSGSPFLCFGPKGGNAHGSDEWVDIKTLEKTKNVYRDLIKEICS